jgi:hypothetical protein
LQNICKNPDFPVDRRPKVRIVADDKKLNMEIQAMPLRKQTLRNQAGNHKRLGPGLVQLSQGQRPAPAFFI